VGGHRACSGIGEEVDEDVVGVEQEQIMVRGAEKLVALLAGSPANGLNALDAKWFDDGLCRHGRIPDWWCRTARRRHGPVKAADIHCLKDWRGLSQAAAGVLSGGGRGRPPDSRSGDWRPALQPVRKAELRGEGVSGFYFGVDETAGDKLTFLLRRRLRAGTPSGQPIWRSALQILAAYEKCF
jgi:hypothetical protein